MLPVAHQFPIRGILFRSGTVISINPAAVWPSTATRALSGMLYDRYFATSCRYCFSSVKSRAFSEIRLLKPNNFYIFIRTSNALS